MSETADGLKRLGKAFREMGVEARSFASVVDAQSEYINAFAVLTRDIQRANQKANRGYAVGLLIALALAYAGLAKLAVWVYRPWLG